MEYNLKLSLAWSKRLKLRAEGDKLRAEGAKLRAEGNKLWAEAIIAAYGNITLSWSWETDHGECTLENGDHYCDDQEAQAAE